MTTIVQHRAVTPDGTVLFDAMMPDYERWMPCYPGCDGREYTLETRVLPDGGWEPSAVLRQPGHPVVVLTRWTL